MIFFRVYPAVALLASFLLFAIQPIAAKALLPHFGGSASVWSVSLLFFMTLLLGGYWYAHLLLRLPFILQRVIHGGLLAASVLFVARVFFSGNTLIGPSLLGGESNFASPVWELLAALFMSVGLPYFLLSTTSSLLQGWWHVFGEAARSPYRLYVFSNAGAFFALASYPFLVEPLASLPVQELAWSLLYLGFVAVIICCFSWVPRGNAGFQISRARGGVSPAGSVPEGPGSGGAAPGAAEYFSWMWLGGLPSLMLLAITNELSRGIAPIPLLWVVPLCITSAGVLKFNPMWGRSVL